MASPARTTASAPTQSPLRTQLLQHNTANSSAQNNNKFLNWLKNQSQSAQTQQAQTGRSPAQRTDQTDQRSTQTSSAPADQHTQGTVAQQELEGLSFVFEKADPNTAETIGSTGAIPADPLAPDQIYVISDEQQQASVTSRVQGLLSSYLSATDGALIEDMTVAELATFAIGISPYVGLLSTDAYASFEQDNAGRDVSTFGFDLGALQPDGQNAELGLQTLLADVTLLNEWIQATIPFVKNGNIEQINEQTFNSIQNYVLRKHDGLHPAHRQLGAEQAEIANEGWETDAELDSMLAELDGEATAAGGGAEVVVGAGLGLGGVLLFSYSEELNESNEIKDEINSNAARDVHTISSQGFIEKKSSQTNAAGNLGSTYSAQMLEQFSNLPTAHEQAIALAHLPAEARLPDGTVNPLGVATSLLAQQPPSQSAAVLQFLDWAESDPQAAGINLVLSNGISAVGITAELISAEPAMAAGILGILPQSTAAQLIDGAQHIITDQELGHLINQDPQAASNWLAQTDPQQAADALATLTVEERSTALAQISTFNAGLILLGMPAPAAMESIAQWALDRIYEVMGTWSWVAGALKELGQTGPRVLEDSGSADSTDSAAAVNGDNSLYNAQPYLAYAAADPVLANADATDAQPVIDRLNNRNRPGLEDLDPADQPPTSNRAPSVLPTYGPATLAAASSPPDGFGLMYQGFMQTSPQRGEASEAERAILTQGLSTPNNTLNEEDTAEFLHLVNNISNMPDYVDIDLSRLPDSSATQVLRELYQGDVDFPTIELPGALTALFVEVEPYGNLVYRSLLPNADVIRAISAHMLNDPQNSALDGRDAMRAGAIGMMMVSTPPGGSFEERVQTVADGLTGALRDRFLLGAWFVGNTLPGDIDVGALLHGILYSDGTDVAPGNSGGVWDGITQNELVSVDLLARIGDTALARDFYINDQDVFLKIANSLIATGDSGGEVRNFVRRMVANDSLNLGYFDPGLKNIVVRHILAPTSNEDAAQLHNQGLLMPLLANAYLGGASLARFVLPHGGYSGVTLESSAVGAALGQYMASLSLQDSMHLWDALLLEGVPERNLVAFYSTEVVPSLRTNAWRSIIGEADVAAGPDIVATAPPATLPIDQPQHHWWIWRPGT